MTMIITTSALLWLALIVAPLGKADYALLLLGAMVAIVLPIVVLVVNMIRWWSLYALDIVEHKSNVEETAMWLTPHQWHLEDKENGVI